MARFSTFLFLLSASIFLQGTASPVQPRGGPLRFRPRVDVSSGNASFPTGNSTSTVIGTGVSSLTSQTSSLSLTSTIETTSVSSIETSTSSSEVSSTSIESSTSESSTSSTEIPPGSTSSTSTTDTSSTSVSIEPSTTEPTSTSNTSEETSSSTSTSTTSEATSTTTNPDPLTSITWSGSWSVSETPTTTAIWSFFPVPTTTIAPAEATQHAILLADLFFALRFNRQWITDPKLKSQYIENLDKTKDEVVALFNALDVKPPPKPDCSSLKRRHLSEKKVRAALANRDLFGAIGDLINDVAGLITCATKIVDNLIDNVKIPVPPIAVIEKLTDALSKIGDDLKDPEDPNDPSTTDRPTSTQSTTTSSSSSSESSSCTGVTAFPVCTQTISLSTSFFSDATSFTVQTVTSTACITSTVTGCASGTTTTTSASSTSSAAPACSPECGSCSKGGTVTDPGADDSEVGTGGEVAVPKKRTVLPKDYEKRTMLEAGTDVDGFYNTILNDKAYEKFQVQHRSSGTKSSAVFRDFEGSPFGLFVDGLFGCTSVTVVSEKGAWMSHFWEAPGFRDGTSLDDFKKNILGPMSTQESINLRRKPGSDRSLPPPTAPAGLMPALFPLLAEGQKLGPETPREIFIQSPHADGDVTAWMYPERVQLVIDHLTGPGQPLAGVTVTTKKYEKFIGTDLEKDPFYLKARTHVFLQYDNKQVASTETAKQKAMWRIWLEDEPHEHGWDATDIQLGSCPLNSRKRDGSCSRPTSSAFEGGTEIPTATSGPTSSAVETTSAPTSEITTTTSVEISTSSSEISTEPSSTIPTTDISSSSLPGTVTTVPTTDVSSTSVSGTATATPSPTTDPSFKPTCNDPTSPLLSPIDFAILRSTDFCQQALQQSTISTTPKYSTTYPHDGLGTGVDVYFKVEWKDVFPGVSLCLGSMSDLIGGCTGGTSRDEQTMGGSLGNGTITFTVTPTDKIIVD